MDSVSNDMPYGKGSIGAGNYTVKQGDSIESIAYKHGFFWEKLWDLPENKELKDNRKNPDALLPGDKVFIPEKEEREETGATEKTHQFLLKGVPSKLVLVFKQGEDAIADEEYRLEVDDKVYRGTTGGEGRIEQPIAPDAKTAKLTLGEGENAVQYEFQIGQIDPIEEISGIQGRLNNLGYGCGEPNGEMNEETIEALKDFQKRNDLQVTGEINEETIDALEKKHYGS